GVAAHQRAGRAQAVLGGVQDTADADYGRAAALEAAGVADCDAPVAALDVRRLAHRHEGPGALVGNLDQAAVDAAIHAQGLALHLPAVRQDDGRVAAGRACDVAGGQDVTVRADDDPAALAAADADPDRAGHDARQHGLDLLLDGAQVGDALRHLFFQ